MTRTLKASETALKNTRVCFFMFNIDCLALKDELNSRNLLILAAQLTLIIGKSARCKAG